MAIDLNHPIIVKMKEVYQRAHSANTDSYMNRNNIIEHSKKKKLFENYLNTIIKVKKEIEQLIKKMAAETTIPSKVRASYIAFMKQHLKNVDGWLDETNKLFNKVSKSKKR